MRRRRLLQSMLRMLLSYAFSVCPTSLWLISAWPFATALVFDLCMQSSWGGRVWLLVEHHSL